MHKAIKWTAIAIASVIAVGGLTAAYIAATFNPNNYKDDIVKLVQDKTGRTLQLKGDIGLSLFPTLGMKLGQASLSERKSAREFASLTEAVVAVKLMPLLAKEVIVDAIEVKGLRATIARDKSGRFNFDDLTGADKKKPEEKAASPLKVDIDHIEIADADVTFVDQAAGSQYRLSKLNLKTGRVANGVTTPLDLSTLIASTKDKAQLDTKAKAKLTFDLEREIYKLADLDFSSKGTFGAWTGLNATAKGNIEARLATGEYVANALVVDMSAKQPDGDVKLRIDAPKLTLTQDKVEGGKLALEAARNEGKRKLVVKATLGGVHGAFKALNAGPLDAHVETQGDGRTLKARLTGALTGNLEARRFELANLKLEATVHDPKIPKGSFDAAINGSGRADLLKETASLDFSGRIDQSNVNGKAGITVFSPPAISFDLNADQLDVDRLLGKSPPGKTADAKQTADKGGGKDDKIDLSALKELNAAGTLKIGKLTLMNLKSSQVRADLKISGGRMDVVPISAQLYQGSLNGSLSAQAAENALFVVKQNLSGVAVGPLLRDAANIDTLEGKGNVNVDLTTRGATVDALKKALNGTAAVNFADGSIKGIDIAGTIRTARTKLQQLRGQQVQQANVGQKTDFTELKASFNVKNGVAHNNDLSMKSPLLRVGGAGDIDIGNDRLNYVLKATLVATTQGQGGKDATNLAGITVPVKLTGALGAPQWSIDFAGMVTDVAKQQLKDEILKRIPGQLPGGKAPGAPAPAGSPPKEDIKDKVKERLKGIFGR